MAKCENGDILHGANWFVENSRQGFLAAMECIVSGPVWHPLQVI